VSWSDPVVIAETDSADKGFWHMKSTAECRAACGPAMERVFLVLVPLLSCWVGCSDRDSSGGLGGDPVAPMASANFVPPPMGDTPSAIGEALRGLGFTETVGMPVERVRLESGSLDFSVCGNSRSPEVLNGLESLGYRKGTERFEAFRTGLNLEHVFSGHRDVHNRFCARRHPYLLCRERGGDSVFLVRLASQSPWSIEHVTRLTLVPPHSIDIDFRCRFHDVSRFGSRAYAGFFWANYMRALHDGAIQFRGTLGGGVEEGWIRAEPMGGWDVGTYLAFGAKALEFDTDHNMGLNLRSFPSPRFTRPFFFSRSAGNMVLMLMFDRMHSGSDEIRFSSFPPAVDFQYIIREVKPERRYGFRARMSWRPWVSREDCLQEWSSWQSSGGGR
jgi:hypothetical protein